MAAGDPSAAATCDSPATVSSVASYPDRLREALAALSQVTLHLILQITHPSCESYLFPQTLLTAPLPSPTAPPQACESGAYDASEAASFTVSDILDAAAGGMDAEADDGSDDDAAVTRVYEELLREVHEFVCRSSSNQVGTLSC
jgi:hypothetical protein